MTTQTTTCDGCGIVKKDTNHWYKLVRDNIIVSVYLAEDYDEEARDADSVVLDLCGRNCLMKAWDAAIDNLREVA